MSEKTLTAVAYLQVRATALDTNDKATQARIVASTQGVPRITDPDVRMVKVRLRLPASAFDPIRAVIDVPAEAVEVPVIEGGVETDE
jgi:hypothetical protein